MSSIPMCTCAVCGASFEVPSGRGQWRKYCSQACNAKAYRERRKRERETFPACELDECSAPRRSRNARWCEAHYIRWYRHGDPRARASTAREPNGTCFHCGGPAPKRRIFCTPLCSTRDRIGAAYVEKHCPVCDGLVPITDRADRVYCAQKCADVGIRARRYGLTIYQFRELVENHGEACAICGTNVKLHIDHCHATGKVRGLLCQNCNFGLGNFSDDISRMLRAIGYLRERGTPS
ncbi:endonuclease VII domain-containing protein [Streptomyces sp. NRRL F-5135]|uniref:endonuclease VII domain-containing protein n=1 Tax=Streptomyces sp. NRRL F-5135 TaxID=1463858 RepID=UPI00099C2AD7